MKLRISIVFLSLITCSCKVTEKSIIGNSYQRLDGYGNLKIEENHTFSYRLFNIRYITKHLPIDSAQIGTVGTWSLSKKKLILNSSSKFMIDTNRFTISKHKNNSGISKFSFKNEIGDPIGIRGISNSRKKLRYVFHTEGYADYIAQTSKIDTLYFQFDFNKSWRFIKEDTASANYMVTIKPAYQPDWFQNKEFTVSQKRLTDQSKKWTFKKMKISAKVPHEFFNESQAGTSYHD